MSLTLGSGPIAPQKTSTAQWNVSFDGAPAHRLVFQPDQRRLRALIGDQVVLDTTRAHLLHESAIMPVVYAPLEDYLEGAWRDTDTSTHCPFKGDAAYRSHVDGEQTLVDLMWLYPEPLPLRNGCAGSAPSMRHASMRGSSRTIASSDTCATPTTGSMRI